MTNDTPQGNPIKTLLIEDNPGDARLIQYMVAEIPSPAIQLQIVDSLSSGCKRLLKGEIDVVLLDLSLPDSQGVNTLTQVQAAAPHVPIVVLTGLDSDEIGLEAVCMGAQDYLIKGQIENRLLSRVLRYAIERKKAENALRESEEKFRSVIEQAADGIMIVDEDFRIIEWSAAQTEIFGYTCDEMLGKYVWEYAYAMMPDEQKSPGALEYLQEISIAEIDGQSPWAGMLFDFEAQCKDGSQKTVQMSAFVVTAADRKLRGATMRDITTRRQAEEELRQERDKIQQYLDVAGVMFLSIDTHRVINLINKRGCEILGYDSPEELIGKDWFDTCIPERSRPEVGVAFAQLLAGNFEPAEYVENPVLTRSGTERIMAWHNTVIKDEGGNITGILSSGEDITKRKRAEEALKQYARQLIVINDISRRVAGVTELEQLLDTVAVMAHESFGYDHVGIFIVDRLREGELVMKAKAGLYAPRFPDGHRLNKGQGMIGWAALYNRKLLANDVSTEPNFYDPFGDGSTKAELSVPILSEGKVVGVIDIQSRHKDAFNDSDVMVMDTLADVLAVAIRNVRLYQELETYNQILEQAVQEATVEVRRTKERVGAILDNNPDAILLLKNNGAIETGNPAFQELFDCHIDDLYGKLLTSLAGPEHVDTLQTALQQVIDTLERRRLEIVLERLDGETFDADMALSPIREGGALEGIVCSIRDITALKEVDRMKDTFISNVSHELRTPITGIKLSHRLIAMDPGKQPVYLERMGREIERLHEIIENLLRLSRLDQGRVMLDIKPLDLNALAAQYVGDRTPMANARQLKLLLNQEPNLPLAQADEGLLGQVLSILLTNAVNYTPSEGLIVVSTRFCETDGKRWVGLRVSDTGPGIPAEDLPRLGERFYRGKTGHDSGAPGTGLGLAIAREIIDRHHGRMEISNEGVEATGASFTVWLPTEDSSVQENHTKKKHSK